MDRKNEKAIVTLGDEELSTVAGAGLPGYEGYEFSFEDYSKYVDIKQHNTATNIVFGGGTLVNSQTNAAVVSQ
jgi:hypothetical protein